MNRPVRFRISSSSVMNSFYVPALSGQIYAMPGMETKLHGVFDETGEYEGFSANYSGWGFSNMRFAVKSLPAGEFDQWVAATKASVDGDLSRAEYLKPETPKHKAPVRSFPARDQKFYDQGANIRDRPGKICHD